MTLLQPFAKAVGQPFHAKDKDEDGQNDRAGIAILKEVKGDLEFLADPVNLNTLMIFAFYKAKTLVLIRLAWHWQKTTYGMV
jgi:hypothetical protein